MVELTEANRQRNIKRAKNWRAENPERARLLSRLWHKRNPERARENAKRWRIINAEKKRAAAKAWNAANTDKIRERRLIKAYGMTLQQYNDLFASQGSACGICKVSIPSGKGWSVDHCHDSKRVRGILCHHCNIMLGVARDNPETLGNAIKYLRKHGH